MMELLRIKIIYWNTYNSWEFEVLLDFRSYLLHLSFDYILPNHFLYKKPQHILSPLARYSGQDRVPGTPHRHKLQFVSLDNKMLLF